MGHTLHRDTKCKWGSMVDMIKSLLEIKPVLQKILKHQTIELSETDWKNMAELERILDPVKKVVEVICREDADLLIAEVYFKKLFKTLESIGTPLALEFLKNLKDEIKKRWHSDVAGLLKYLNNPQKNKPMVPERARKRARIVEGKKYDLVWFVKYK